MHLKCSQMHEAMLFEAISCINNQIPSGSPGNINAIRGGRKLICILHSALQVWSRSVLNPQVVEKEYRKLMSVHLYLHRGVHTYVLLHNKMQPGWYVCCFTYESCLCSRCGKRVAPGQNCRVTCLNRGRRSCWNVAAVTADVLLRTTGRHFVKKHDF